MASGLVFVNDVLVGNAIDNASGFLENVSSCCFVAGFDGLAHTLDRGASHGAQAGIVLVVLKRLTGAIADLGGIGHLGVYPVLCMGYSVKTDLLSYLIRTVKFERRNLTLT